MDNLGNAYTFVKYAWDHEGTNSFSKLNSLMYNALNLAIDANMFFEINDFENIYKKMSGGYWFHANSNGKGIGEQFYRRSISENNTSAIKSFENWNKLKAFILNGKRLCAWTGFWDNELQYSVTGFSNDYKIIYIVAYKRTDRTKQGKRKLLNFTNKEWLDFRKSDELVNDI